MLGYDSDEHRLPFLDRSRRDEDTVFVRLLLAALVVVFIMGLLFGFLFAAALIGGF